MFYETSDLIYCPIYMQKLTVYAYMDGNPPKITFCGCEKGYCNCKECRECLEKFKALHPECAEYEFVLG